jgi:RNase P subunit RPR2
LWGVIEIRVIKGLDVVELVMKRMRVLLQRAEAIMKRGRMRRRRKIGLARDWQERWRWKIKGIEETRSWRWKRR